MCAPKGNPNVCDKGPHGLTWTDLTYAAGIDDAPLTWSVGDRRGAWVVLVARRGFEPRTFRFSVERSTN